MLTAKRRFLEHWQGNDYRENVSSSNAEEYLRRVIFISIVDYFISEFELRLNPGFYGILPMEGLIPLTNAIHNGNDIHAALKYNGYFKSWEFQLKSEFKIWRKNGKVWLG
ncbi:hypothetical protein AVEN_206265-1 [Araneus ventricosus]|uniref:Uncharacterized protein n=1 Tax=Araneus ventricosus TaxID=182803 RepID=A0A4Y2M500_ARAVE|nr:hypothetical protein AVEN_206265-1 [Araneus ventricosus]